MTAVTGARRAYLGWALPGRNSLAWPLCGLAVTLLIELNIALSRALNWDEFWHLAQVYSLLDGTLSSPLQTVYARAFSWVVQMPGSGIDHILIIRLFMFACLATTTLCVIAMAARFTGRAEATLAGLLYLSAGFVLQHGSSFRIDPMAAMLLTGSLLILLRTRLQLVSLSAAAALAALAGLLTIKSVLYAPAFCGVAWFRLAENGYSRDILLRLCGLAVLAVIMFALFYLMHSAGLADGTGSSAEFVLSSSAQRMFDGPSSYFYATKAAKMAPLFAVSIFALPFLLRRSAPDRNTAILMVTLWLPITVIAFYRNSYPYFYVFILPTVAVACAVVLAGTFRRYGAAFLTAALVANAVAIASFEKHDVLERQRELLAGVEAVFPEPVAYFDYPAMLGIFPKANAFMSSWGSQNYLEGQSPTYGQIMARRAIPLVLENNAMFSNVLTGRPDSHFMPADAAALRENYIRFWGPVWLAGRELQEDESRTVEIAVPGPYTVADGAIVIDGKRYLSGEVVQLDRKSYRLRASDSSVRLIWGDHLVRPDSPPPAPPYWTEF